MAPKCIPGKRMGQLRGRGTIPPGAMSVALHGPKRLAPTGFHGRLRAKIPVGGLIPARANAKRWIAEVVKNLNRGLTGIRLHADGANRCIARMPLEKTKLSG